MLPISKIAPNAAAQTMSNHNAAAGSHAGMVVAKSTRLARRMTSNAAASTIRITKIERIRRRASLDAKKLLTLSETNSTATGKIASKLSATPRRAVEVEMTKFKVSNESGMTGISKVVQHLLNI
jgi:hypothetical protein